MDAPTCAKPCARSKATWKKRGDNDHGEAGDALPRRDHARAERFNAPLAAYQVSGRVRDDPGRSEKWLVDGERVMMESLRLSSVAHMILTTRKDGAAAAASA